MFPPCISPRYYCFKFAFLLNDPLLVIDWLESCTASLWMWLFVTHPGMILVNDFIFRLQARKKHRKRESVKSGKNKGHMEIGSSIRHMEGLSLDHNSSTATCKVCMAVGGCAHTAGSGVELTMPKKRKEKKAGGLTENPYAFTKGDNFEGKSAVERARLTIGIACKVCGASGGCSHTKGGDGRPLKKNPGHIDAEESTKLQSFISPARAALSPSEGGSARAALSPSEGGGNGETALTRSICNSMDFSMSDSKEGVESPLFGGEQSSEMGFGLEISSPSGDTTVNVAPTPKSGAEGVVYI